MLFSMAEELAAIREDRPQLLVRVYPDVVHVDSHERQLTAPEADWGRRYWELTWGAARDQELQRRAWEQIVERFGARRAHRRPSRPGPGGSD